MSPLVQLENEDGALTSEFLDSFDTVLTDCDGVLWEGNEAIQGSPQTINLLREAGKKIIYVTNNGTRSRKEYVKKCQKLGFGGDFTEIFTTSYLCAKYLQLQNFNKKVYIFGNEGIAKELDEASIKHTGTEPDPEPFVDMQTVTESVSKAMTSEDKEEIGCVIATFNYHITVKKMAIAVSYLDDPNVIFIGSNRDPRFPCHGGIVLPGTGAFIKAIETSAGREAIVLGKPEKFMFEAISDCHKIDPKRTIMIGDRCDTDILFGKNNKIRTLLVGTGIHSLKEVTEWAKSDDAYKQSLVPDYYLSSLGKLIPFVKKLAK